MCEQRKELFARTDVNTLFEDEVVPQRRVSVLSSATTPAQSLKISAKRLSRSQNSLTLPRSPRFGFESTRSSGTGSPRRKNTRKKKNKLRHRQLEVGKGNNEDKLMSVLETELLRAREGHLRAFQQARYAERSRRKLRATDDEWKTMSSQTDHQGASIF